MSKKTFIFYKDREDYMEEMTLEEIGLFTQTVLRYQNGKELGDISIIRFVWSKVKKQLEADNKKRAEELEKRSKAGIEGNKKRRGNRKSSQVIASATSGSQVIADNVNVNVNDNVNVKENDNKIVKPLNEVTENEKKIIASFIRYQYDNKKQMKTMIDNKGPDKYLQTSIDEYCKLLKKYTTQEIIEVLQYIVKDTFRQNNILSIRKLSDKNKDGFKFIDVILDRIKTPQNNVTIANIF